MTNPHPMANYYRQFGEWLQGYIERQDERFTDMTDKHTPTQRSRSLARTLLHAGLLGAHPSLYSWLERHGDQVATLIDLEMGSEYDSLKARAALFDEMVAALRGNLKHMPIKHPDTTATIALLAKIGEK